MIVGVPAVSAGARLLSDNGGRVAPTDLGGGATLSPFDNHARGQKRVNVLTMAMALSRNPGTSKQRQLPQKRAEQHAARLARQTIVRVSSPGTVVMIARKLVSSFGQHLQAGKHFDSVTALIAAWFDAKTPEQMMAEMTELLSGEGRVELLEYLTKLVKLVLTCLRE